MGQSNLHFDDFNLILLEKNVSKMRQQLKIVFRALKSLILTLPMTSALRMNRKIISASYSFDICTKMGEISQNKLEFLHVHDNLSIKLADIQNIIGSIGVSVDYLQNIQMIKQNLMEKIQGPSLEQADFVAKVQDVQMVTNYLDPSNSS